MADMSVSPYWELMFDADGDPDTDRRDRLVAQVRERGVRDLLVFAHGWNNDRSIATRLYSRFFAPFPRLAPGAGLGYAGVLWPSLRFTDEPTPDFDPALTGGAGLPPEGQALPPGTLEALNRSFPGSAQVIAEADRLLTERPDDAAALDEFGHLVRKLAEVPEGGPQSGFVSDSQEPEEPPGPTMLTADTAMVCRGFLDALARAGATEGVRTGRDFGLGVDRLWNGALELLRQTTYYVMKRRAGTIGQLGLGPLLGHLAREAPEVRVHLMGHSFGGRLVSYALRGLPDGVRTVRSVTLLQGAFSHYVFAERLPHRPSGSGALRGQQRRVAGPLVCCYSRYDTALGVFYPLASQMAGDATSLIGSDDTWGALGYDGVQAVDGTAALTLREALSGPLPRSGCVNVDAAEVVRRGPPPVGAHSDICHEELARVVLAAGRIT